MILKANIHFLFAALSLLFFYNTSFAASCPASSNNVSNITSCIVTGSASNIQLNFISGFDSTENATPQGGNNGTSIGEQRRLAFIKAAEMLAAQIASSQTIVVDASFSGLTCNADSAVLGSAGAMGSIAYDATDTIPTGALIDTFYPIALFNALENNDAAPSSADIQAEFNANLGGEFCLRGGAWYYGFDNNSNDLTGFLTVLLHEITHGLGFTSLVDPSTGEKAQAINSDGSITEINDIYSNFLYIKSEGKTWQQLTSSASDNLKRKNSAISGNDLFWSGSKANALAVGQLTAGYADNDNNASFSTGDHIQIYAPSPIEQGSSVSHFDVSVSPDELMEPKFTGYSCDAGLALGVLEDIGWSINAATKPAFYLNINCDTVENGQTYSNVFNGDVIKISPVSGTTAYTYSLTYEGQNADSLVTQTSDAFYINTQSSGEFAGVYVLTVSNGADPDITITINRPLRVIWSSEALLNDESYSLTIEGGAANTVYDLTQNQVNVINFLNQQNQNITSVTATNNPTNYNPALLNISSNTVNAALNVATTVKSQSNTYADVSDDIIVYPSLKHTFTIIDSSNTAIGNASAVLANSNLISAVGITRNYTSSSTGTFTVNLPNTNDSFSVVVSKAGYSEQTLAFNASQTHHSVTLTSTSTPTMTENKPKFGSGGGGSLPFGFMLLIGLLVLQRLRP